MLFDRLGDLAYRTVCSLPSVTAGEWDIIHAHQALPDGALAQRLAADLRVPWVVTVHGADVYQHSAWAGCRATRQTGAGGASDGEPSVVARLLRDVVAPERLTVVLNGTTGLAEQVEPASGYLPGEPLVLTVGQLIERKGTADLIAAVGKLRRSGRRVQLAIVGEGPLRQALGERASAEGVAGDVHFVGRMEHAGVLAMMARAQLFALPSWDEAFGLCLPEAMAREHLCSPLRGRRGLHRPRRERRAGPTDPAAIVG
jgi:glycosyltransferase involved in cell wall biosynthesis